MNRTVQIRAWKSVADDLQLLLDNPAKSKWRNRFEEITRRAELANPWFTLDQQRTAFAGIIKLLDPEYFNSWVLKYPSDHKRNCQVGIIMAGNIPMAGFHDLLCVLLSGHTAVAKLSASDKFLLPFITEILVSHLPEIGEKIRFEEQLKTIDAIIATGSNNTSRYFDYYFGKKPHIFRKNRNSVAIIDGSENEYDFVLLGRDIFTYFGLGCRSISKLYVPEGYVFDDLFANLISYNSVMSHSKYMNNYDYHQALYLLNRQAFLTNNFIIITQSDALSSPVGVLFYETYSDEKDLQEKLNAVKDQIQCVVRKNSHTGPGQAQFPLIHEFADGVDTMNFLQNL